MNIQEKKAKNKQIIHFFFYINKYICYKSNFFYLIKANINEILI